MLCLAHPPEHGTDLIDNALMPQWVSPKKGGRSMDGPQHGLQGADVCVVAMIVTLEVVIFYLMKWL